MSDIILRDLRFAYPALRPGSEAVRVLNGIDLQVERGEFLTVMGPTGAGKTTLCLALNGLVPHSTGGRFGGEVIVAGLNTREHPVARLASRVGLVFQDAESQLFNMTVEDEVAFGPEGQGLPRAEIGERVAWALAAVGMSAHRERSPFHLSGGQKQRVAIAAMLAMLPQILVLDEPTAGLDPLGKAEVFEVIRQLQRQRQMTILLVEQEAEKVAEFSDRVAVLHEGRIALIGSPDEIFAQVNRLRDVGVAVPQVSELATLFNGHGRRHFTFTTLDDAWHALAFPGRPPITPPEKMDIPPMQRIEQANTALCVQVQELWHHYGGQNDALRGVDLEIHAGEWTALVGQNGSGKTTLAKHLNGLLKPSRGSVRIYGQDTTRASVGQLARQVGYVFQNPDHQIFSPTVRDEIAFGPRNLGLPPDEVAQRVAETLARFRLEAHAETPPALLGYGLRRQVGVAAVYAMRPRLFILDEPTAGLDGRGVEELMTLLAEMNAAGHTILLITHDMRIVARYARRVIVLHQGQVLLDGSPQSVFQQTERLAVAHLEPPQMAQLARRFIPWGMPQGILTVEPFYRAYQVCLATVEGGA
ncbi:MAG: ABC transporter ATP-binding protein [Chloroflexota bacterium]